MSNVWGLLRMSKLVEWSVGEGVEMKRASVLAAENRSSSHFS